VRPSPCRHVRRVAGAALRNLRSSGRGSRTAARCSLSTAGSSSSRLCWSSLGCRPSHRPCGCYHPRRPPCRACFQDGRRRLHLPPGGLLQKMHFLLPRSLAGRQFYLVPPVWWASARSSRRRRSRECNCRPTIRPGRRRRGCSNRCSSCRSRFRNPQPCPRRINCCGSLCHDPRSYPRSSLLLSPHLPMHPCWQLRPAACQVFATALATELCRDCLGGLEAHCSPPAMQRFGVWACGQAFTIRRPRRQAIAAGWCRGCQAASPLQLVKVQHSRLVRQGCSPVGYLSGCLFLVLRGSPSRHLGRVTRSGALPTIKATLQL